MSEASLLEVRALLAKKAKYASKKKVAKGCSRNQTNIYTYYEVFG